MTKFNKHTIKTPHHTKTRNHHSTTTPCYPKANETTIDKNVRVIQVHHFSDALAQRWLCGCHGWPPLSFRTHRSGFSLFCKSNTKKTPSLYNGRWTVRLINRISPLTNVAWDENRTHVAFETLKRHFQHFQLMESKRFRCRSLIVAYTGVYYGFFGFLSNR